jgi:hypothetical protein
VRYDGGIDEGRAFAPAPHIRYDGGHEEATAFLSSRNGPAAQR